MRFSLAVSCKLLLAMAKKNAIRRRLIAFSRVAAAALALGLPLSVMAPLPAAAQFFPFFGPYQAPPEQPKPPPDYSRAPAPKKAETAPTTTVIVMGDSMADWLAYGLEDAFSDTPEIGIIRKHRAYSGLIRYEARSDLDWPRVARDILAAEKPAAVIMLLGLSDRQTIRERPNARGSQQQQQQGQDQQTPDAESPETRIMTPEPPRGAGGNLEFRSEPWAEAYARRIDDAIAALRSKGIPVIWVGLPPVRGPKAMSDTAYLNDLYRAQAEKAGIIFVDVWDGFVDEAGKYSTYGPDVDGQTRSLRTPDGVYFTKYGARKLAHYVERELRRVMSVRAVPVALPSDDGLQMPGALRPGVPAPRPVAGPIIPLTATSTSTSEELLGGGTARPGAPDPIAARVLVKGEPVTPLKGRADDFLWPPSGPAAASETDKPPEAQSKPPEAQSVTPAPSVTTPATVDTGKKAAAPGKQTKQDAPTAEAASSSQASAPPPAQKKPAASASRDVPRPPAPIGQSGFNPFSLFR